MIKHLFSSLLLAAAMALPANAQIGSWNSYLSYHELEDAVKATDNLVYVLASGGLYSYNTHDHSIQTFSKTDLLNDCDIAYISWCQQAKKLVIVYQNYNIDLLSVSGDEVINIADYKDKSLTGDKTVNGISIVGQYAYLCTNFGMVKVNVADGEIADTYQLSLTVYNCYEQDGYLYANCRQGLRRAPLSSNMLDPSNWKWVAAYEPQTKTIDEDLKAELETLSPGGPLYNHFGEMRFKHNRLYTTTGGYNVSNDLYRKGAVQILNGDEWTILKDDDNSFFFDLSTVDADPNDADHVMVGGRTGLFEFDNGAIVNHYSYDNSLLAAVFAGNKGYVVVQGMVYDDSGNLWLSNNMTSEQNILQITSSGEWVSHYQSAFTDLINMRSFIIDSRSLIWFTNDSWITPSFYCYQPSTDATMSYTTFINQDGTDVAPTSVHCVAEDKDHNIWVGTSAGPLLLTPSDISSGSQIFTQVKVPRNDGTNLADYLLSGVNISCIVVDKANRKWMGTQGSGVYCIGSDNISQVYHFTTENSKLFSDEIEAMAINDETGEIYISTEKGLCSYMSNANLAVDGMTKESVYAYPNPVRPGYRGAITITGLESDADVKIVSTNGTLIEEGRASDGQYKWYGLDKQSRLVASGIYMVEVATADGEKGVVCKIAVVR